MDNSSRNLLILASVIAFLGGVGSGYLIWGNQPPKIVTVAQSQVETVEGVQNIVKETKIPIDNNQVKEVAQQVAVKVDTQPSYTVSTNKEQLTTSVEKERERNKADFTILTDPKNKEQPVDVKSYQEKQPINLNQYNIKAYKKHFYGTEYYPKNMSDWKPAMVEADYGWKLTNSGQYVGLSVSHNFDNKRTYGGIRIEF